MAPSTCTAPTTISSTTVRGDPDSLAASFDGPARLQAAQQPPARRWITLATNALASRDPPNVGVVGPRVSHETTRWRRGMTQDFVHATHLDIFAEYYPPQLDNWCADATPMLHSGFVRVIGARA